MRQVDPYCMDHHCSKDDHPIPDRLSGRYYRYMSNIGGPIRSDGSRPDRLAKLVYRRSSEEVLGMTLRHFVT